MSQSKANRTQQDLEMAILRIERNRPRVIEKSRKLSILAVAQEAGMSGASIHNNYPEIAEKIRVKINKETRVQRDEKNSELKIEKEKNKMLRVKVANLTSQLRDMASENARFLTENLQLNAIINSENVHVINKSKT